ncbi:uncharacterized protein TNCV_2997091 [Trichonephila clavipes]|nr:uncharacterized protein TNCV_2997091 [Trichonephila clavipes]
MELKSKANDRSKNLALRHNEFCGPRSDATVNQNSANQHFSIQAGYSNKRLGLESKQPEKYEIKHKVVNSVPMYVRNQDYRYVDRQHECQYGRNEIGVDRQHECQYGRNEIGVDHQYRRSEYQALTNVNEQISANKEELKSDLKGIGDKLTTMDKKFEEMEGRIKSVENKFENKFVDIENKFENKFEDMESKLEAKIFEKVEAVSISFRSDLEKLKQKVMTGQGDEFKFQAPYSKPSIKLSTYDGKSSWQVYKTQFSIVADANQWDSQTKACQLAASLRADAADILQTLPETQRLDFDALVNALELRFGEKCVKDYSRLQLKSRQQKVSETLQELATDVERLLTWRFLTVRLK